MYVPLMTNDGQKKNYSFSLGPDEYLISSILLESSSTCLLKKATENHYYYIPAYLGYVISFYLFPKSLEKYSLSFAYTLWCSVGICFTMMYDVIFQSLVVTAKKIFGIGFMAIGVYMFY